MGVAQARRSQAVIRCPLCGGDTATAFSVGDRNRGFGHERFEYRRCSSCRSYHLADPPDDLARYYPADYYRLPPAEDLDRQASAEAPRLRSLASFASGGRLIDVGAGHGVFARAARNAGFEVTAIEMDRRCCDYLERVVGVQAIRSGDPAHALIGLEPARAITLWHVLEHLPSPWEVLEAAAERLEPGGALVVATPNPDSLQFSLLQGRWPHVDAPRHLFLIPLAALGDQARRRGLRLAHVTSRDPAGIQLNRFGWEYFLRGLRGQRPSWRGLWTLTTLLTGLLAPLERRGLRGAAYTATFVKS
jgi:2-polyprenyl-3-methyl-5-hydroxy-6-metoxy-1,4-benzoquinol methylase